MKIKSQLIDIVYLLLLCIIFLPKLLGFKAVLSFNVELILFGIMIITYILLTWHFEKKSNK